METNQESNGEGLRNAKPTDESYADVSLKVRGSSPTPRTIVTTLDILTFEEWLKREKGNADITIRIKLKKLGVLKRRVDLWDVQETRNFIQDMSARAKCIYI